jgi:hypothetical protein
MKNLLILATLMIFTGFANAQDAIYNKNGTSWSSDIIGYHKEGKIYNKNGTSWSSDIIGYYKGGTAAAAAAAFILLIY